MKLNKEKIIMFINPKIYKKVYDFSMDIKDFKTIPIANFIVNHRAGFLSFELLHYIAQYKHAKVKKYLCKLLPGQQKYNDFGNEGKYELSSPIWFAWLQGEKNLPLIPDLCWRRLKYFCNGRPIHFVSLENYQDFVTLPQSAVIAFQKKKISYTFFADILRAALLYKHGGLWMDATILLTDKLQENIFTSPWWSIKIPEYGEYISRCRWSAFFIAGWKNNALFGLLLDSFDKYLQQKTNLVDFFLIDYCIDKIVSENKIFQDMVNSVAISNSHLYALTPLLLEPYSEKKYREITRDTSIFKINRHRYTNEILKSDSGNFFSYLNNI